MSTTVAVGFLDLVVASFLGTFLALLCCAGIFYLLASSDPKCRACRRCCQRAIKPRGSPLSDGECSCSNSSSSCCEHDAYDAHDAQHPDESQLPPDTTQSEFKEPAQEATGSAAAAAAEQVPPQAEEANAPAAAAAAAEQLPALGEEANAAEAQGRILKRLDAMRKYDSSVWNAVAEKVQPSAVAETVQPLVVEENEGVILARLAEMRGYGDAVPAPLPEDNGGAATMQWKSSLNEPARRASDSALSVTSAPVPLQPQLRPRKLQPRRVSDPIGSNIERGHIGSHVAERQQRREEEALKRLQTLNEQTIPAANKPTNTQAATDAFCRDLFEEVLLKLQDEEAAATKNPSIDVAEPLLAANKKASSDDPEPLSPADQS